MKTNNTKNEQISAFADGEIDTEQVGALINACRQEPHFQAWDIYHQIGDVLRSDDMAQQCSTDFNAKLLSRLALEPAYLSAGASRLHSSGSSAMSPSPTGRRFARSSRMLSGIAAGAAVLYFGGAYLVAGTSDSGTLSRLTAWARQSPDSAATSTKIAQASAGAQVVVMRDPQIDAYLIAHQQFSPSLYSTAQFARAASFANESAK